MEFTTDDRKHVRILLIVDDGEPVANTLALPRTGDAIYRQSNGIWKKEYSEDRNSDLSVEITPGYGGGVNLQTKGPCCSSFSQTNAPYAHIRKLNNAEKFTSAKEPDESKKVR